MNLVGAKCVRLRLASVNVLLYTIRNPTLLHNVSFPWLASGFTSLTTLDCGFERKKENVKIAFDMVITVLEIII